MGKKIKEGDSIGLFEFFLGSYMQTSKDRLIELMKDSDDIEALKELGQEELAVIYCERMTLAAMKQSQNNNSKVATE